MDIGKESRGENLHFPKTKKKFYKKRLKERFIVCSKYRKKKSLVVKYELSLPGKPVVSLGKTVLQEEAFKIPVEEINIEPSHSRDFTAGKARDQKKYDLKDLVNIVDLNRNQEHKVKINSELSDEILHSYEDVSALW